MNSWTYKAFSTDSTAAKVTQLATEVMEGKTHDMKVDFFGVLLFQIQENSTWKNIIKEIPALTRNT